jgi:hypothetical protein
MIAVFYPDSESREGDTTNTGADGDTGAGDGATADAGAAAIVSLCGI